MMFIYSSSSIEHFVNGKFPMLLVHAIQTQLVLHSGILDEEKENDMLMYHLVYLLPNDILGMNWLPIRCRVECGALSRISTVKIYTPINKMVKHKILKE